VGAAGLQRVGFYVESDLSGRIGRGPAAFVALGWNIVAKRWQAAFRETPPV
jgi:hypothetical protein